MNTLEFLVQSHYRGKWRDVSPPVSTLAEAKRDLAGESNWRPDSKHRIVKIETTEKRTVIKL
jgi:hypothetical protein